MKIKTHLWLAIIILVTACSSEVKQTPLADNAVIVAFGDSLTVGYGTTIESSYPSQLNKMLRQTVINAGISGEETSASLKRIDSVLKLYRPALVLLCIGGNDFLRKRSSQTTQANIGLLIDKIHQAGSTVVLIAVPELGLFLSPSEIYSNLSESRNVLLIEDVLADLIGENSLKSDAIHLNAKGYRVFAEKIAAELKSFGLIH
jgi:lysophospholipase L1-like esterase